MANQITIASDVAVSSCSGSGPAYTVNYSGTDPVINVNVGDDVTVNKRVAGAGGGSSITSVYTYKVTGYTDSDTLTLTYVSDTQEDGDDSPCDLPSGTGSSGSPNKASHTFKRDIGSAFLMFVD
tara:strand:+ start:125 stop:496 length:372 start_codon:yes stop_codon:yes gene_type:complete